MFWTFRVVTEKCRSDRITGGRMDRCGMSGVGCTQPGYDTQSGYENKLALIGFLLAVWKANLSSADSLRLDTI